MFSNILKFFLFIVLINTAGHIHAQDSLQLIRKFVQLSSGYQQAPLSVKMVISRQSDIIDSPQDSATSHAEFCLLKTGSYVRMDGMVQVANDSLMLLIADAGQRMMLYPNKTGWQQQMAARAGWQLQDSSLIKMAGKYTAKSGSDAGSHAQETITLDAKEMITGTGLPRETIEMTYHTSASVPVKIVQLQRKLIPLEPSTYQALLTQPEYAGKLAALEGGKFYLVKTYSTTYDFLEIKNGDDVAGLPLQINQCVGRTAGGQYEPVKDYTGYALTQNF
ncbi:hypothetical protein [Foetidibacter luteolus]|uniref:hypothetical protein n=1 Tax=Foetidibacter luteolus TaxID=2608880 RepID=UPI00129C07AC|nr:hypothetical protein [Foetidibacter luteolus]